MDKSFRGRARRLDDIDLPKLGARIGVGEDELHAFIDVETRGSGFDGEGRPRILFERHVFYKYVPRAKRAAAVNAGLASKAPGGYGKESEQYGKLLKAMAIDARAALYSCSWGLAQIMGFNHKLAGYATVEAMVAAFLDDEETHLEAAVTFIKACKLDDELRAHNWKAFARGYNGPNYAINSYDAKLALAFAKWKRIKDTPLPAGKAEESDPSPPASDDRPEPPRPPVTPPPAEDGQKDPPAPKPKKLRWSKRLWNGIVALVTGGGVAGSGLDLWDVDRSFFIVAGCVIVACALITILFMPEVRALVSKRIVGFFTAIAVLSLLPALAWDLGAYAHQAPNGWTYPMQCCSNRDCNMIPASRVSERQDGYHVTLQPGDHDFVKAASSWVIPYASTKPSPDGAFHICIGMDLRLLCFFAGDKGF